MTTQICPSQICATQICVTQICTQFCPSFFCPTRPVVCQTQWTCPTQWICPTKIPQICQVQTCFANTIHVTNTIWPSAACDLDRTGWQAPAQGFAQAASPALAQKVGQTGVQYCTQHPQYCGNTAWPGCPVDDTAWPGCQPGTAATICTQYPPACPQEQIGHTGWQGCGVQAAVGPTGVQNCTQTADTCGHTAWSPCPPPIGPTGWQGCGAQAAVGPTGWQGCGAQAAVGHTGWQGCGVQAAVGHTGWQGCGTQPIGQTGVQNCTQTADACGHTAWQKCPPPIGQTGVQNCTLTPDACGHTSWHACPPGTAATVCTQTQACQPVGPTGWQGCTEAACPTYLPQHCPSAVQCANLAAPPQGMAALPSATPGCTCLPLTVGPVQITKQMAICDDSRWLICATAHSPHCHSVLPVRCPYTLPNAACPVTLPGRCPDNSLLHAACPVISAPPICQITSPEMRCPVPLQTAWFKLC